MATKTAKKETKIKNLAPISKVETPDVKSAIIDPMEELITHPYMIVELKENSKFKLDFEMDRDFFTQLFALHNKLITINMSLPSDEIKTYIEVVNSLLNLCVSQAAKGETITPMKRKDWLVKIAELQKQAEEELKKKMEADKKEKKLLKNN